jgi:hypothetical protein
MPIFNCDIPEGWEDHTIYMFMGPQHFQHQHVLTLNLVHKPGQNDLEDFGKERIEAMIGTSDDLDVVKDKIISLPSGKEAYEFVYRWIPSGNRILFRRIVCMLINKIGYVFSVDFTKPSLKTVGLEVMQFIDSFNPIEDNS